LFQDQDGHQWVAVFKGDRGRKPESGEIFMEIRNCVAVVTGGASGLGEATVREFVCGGGKAVIADPAEEKGRRLAEEFTGEALYVKTHVNSEGEVAELLKRTRQAFGGFNMTAGKSPAFTEGMKGACPQRGQAKDANYCGETLANR